jgi:hypothetical protein
MNGWFHWTYEGKKDYEALSQFLNQNRSWFNSTYGSAKEKKKNKKKKNKKKKNNTFVNSNPNPDPIVPDDEKKVKKPKGYKFKGNSFNLPSF